MLRDIVMKKQAIQFDSPLDALLAIARRLSRYESEAGMDSEDFFARYTKGEIDDEARFVDWANDYRHYLSLRSELDKKLHDAA
jgi:hypothetical protein